MSYQINITKYVITKNLKVVAFPFMPDDVIIVSENLYNSMAEEIEEKNKLEEKKVVNVAGKSNWGRNNEIKFT